jgi:hypothetical protein
MVNNVGACLTYLVLTRLCKAHFTLALLQSALGTYVSQRRKDVSVSGTIARQIAQLYLLSLLFLRGYTVLYPITSRTP